LAQNELYGVKDQADAARNKKGGGFGYEEAGGEETVNSNS
jgi:hypothetical protein